MTKDSQYTAGFAGSARLNLGRGSGSSRSLQNPVYDNPKTIPKIKHDNPMKSKSITMAAALLALASSGLAQSNNVYITGATAFRSATLNTVRTIFANTGQYKIVHNGGSGNYNGSTYAIIQGTFSNVPGTTTIYTSFNGSVEGIRALVTTNNNPEYLTISALTNATNFIAKDTIGDGVSGISSPRAQNASDFAFSDVSKASTPYAADSLLPANNSAQVGVVTFTMIANKGGTNLDNLNSQNFRALLGQGYVPASLINGITNDPRSVYVVGRNDGSGTRTTYAAETGYGISTLMNQYIVGKASNGAVRDIYLVPQGGTNNALNGAITNGGLALIGSSANVSTVWGQNVNGNGGYASGSGITAAFTNTSPSVNIYDASGELLDTANIALVSFLSTGDAKTAMAFTNSTNSGGITLGYNGVKLSDFATNGGTLSQADKNKITRGAYTAWGYQYFYRLPTITTGAKLTTYNLIFSNVPANLGSAGLPKSQMTVSRLVDGGVVAP